MAYRPFEELEVRQKACKRARRVFDILKDSSRICTALRGRATRAAVSTACNQVIRAELKRIASMLHGLVQAVEEKKAPPPNI